MSVARLQPPFIEHLVGILFFSSQIKSIGCVLLLVTGARALKLTLEFKGNNI